MKPITVGLLLFVTVLIFTGVVGAQDEVGCTAEQWESIASGLADITAQIPTAENPYEMLMALELAIDATRYACFGELYNSELYPNGIFGPVMFSSTLYQFTLSSSEQFTSLDMTVLEGDCGFSTFMAVDSESLEETDLFEFGGDCIAIFEVNSSGGTWSVDIQRLR